MIKDILSFKHFKTNKFPVEFPEDNTITGANARGAASFLTIILTVILLGLLIGLWIIDNKTGFFQRASSRVYDLLLKNN